MHMNMAGQFFNMFFLSQAITSEEYIKKLEVLQFLNQAHPWFLKITSRHDMILT